MRLDSTGEDLRGSSYSRFVKYGGEDAEKWCEEVYALKREFLHRRIEAQKQKRYDDLIAKVQDATPKVELLEVLKELEGMLEYENAEEYINKCKNLISIKEDEERRNEEKRKQELYDGAVAIVDDQNCSLGNLKEAKQTLLELRTWKNIEDVIKKCEERISYLEEKRRKTQQRLKVGGIVLVAIAIVLAIVIAATEKQWKQASNEWAMDVMQKGNYSFAAKLFDLAENGSYYDYCEALSKLDSITYEDEFGSVYYTIVKYNYLDNIQDLRNKNQTFRAMDDMRGQWYDSDGGRGYKVCVDSGKVILWFNINGNVSEYTYDLYVSKDNLEQFDMKKKNDRGQLYRNDTLLLNKDGKLREKDEHWANYTKR